MNKRYLKYIKPFNPKKEIKLADSKLKTKKLLENLDIPHPKLIDVIKTRKQLKEYDFSRFIGKDFVVKPNKGSKGKGILICHMLDENSVKTSSGILSLDDFKKQITDILDGKFSLTMGNDIVLIEEKIIPGDEFKLFCEHGLADIRLISMNLIPVMAMLRYPTEKSEGKANIAKGGIGFGIDIVTGKIFSMYYEGKIYKKKFPQPYEQFYNKKILYWDDILLYSSQIQYFTNIGYLGLDWVISQNGPSLLEINARAGMEIQLVNGLGLETRLKKIQDMKVDSPSKGVEISKTLFSKNTTNIAIKKNIIYLQQQGTIKIENNYMPITIKSSLDQVKNFASSDIIPDFNKSYTLKFHDTVLNNIKFEKDDNLGTTITLGTKELEDFLIIPKNKDIKDFSIWKKEVYKTYEENILSELDDRLDKLSKKLNISKLVKPKNYMEELDNFITWGGNYNPKFTYKYPNEKKIEDIYDSLQRVKEKYFNIKVEYKSELLNLFKEKLLELEYKLELVKAYKKQDFKKIGKYNRLLYGELNDDLLNIAKLNIDPNFEKNLGRKLSISEVVSRVQNHLLSKGLPNVQIKLESNASSRILVKRGEPIVVTISKMSDFYEKEIDMILAHEIDVHVMRYINGKKTGWKILQSGTAFYLTDEEGLAIWNSFNYLPSGYKKTGIYEKYYLLYQAEKTDFVSLSNIIRGMNPNDGLLKIFRKTMRYKRGIQNTAFKGFGTAYLKDKIYLDGYEKVKNWIENGGEFEKMLKGKYKIEDLKYIAS